MDDILPTVIGIILLLVIVVLDWPRAVAGMVVVLVAGVCTFGLHRVLWRMLDGV